MSHPHPPSHPKPPTWLPETRDFDTEIEKFKSLSFTTCSKHPLLSATVDFPSQSPERETNKKPSEETSDSTRVAKKTILEKISFDPLQAFAISNSNQTQDITDSIDTSEKASDFNEKVWNFWELKRSFILKKYSTTQSIPVSADFLDKELQEDSSLELNLDPQKKLEIMKIEESAEKKMQFLTQKELVFFAEQNVKNLYSSWNAKKKVQSLKIAIQGAKMISEIFGHSSSSITSVIKIFPSIFVLCEQIMTKFGQLVYNRIACIERDIDFTSKDTDLDFDFNIAEVSPESKEICLNWFYKIACIRELIPRFFVETALLQCYKFLYKNDDILSILSRLAKQIRGIGNALIATYARAYLAYRAIKIFKIEMISDILLELLNDFLVQFNNLKKTNFLSKISKTSKSSNISVDDYLGLFSPAVEFLCLAVCSSKLSPDAYFALLQQYNDLCGSSLILHYLIASLPTDFTSSNALMLIKLIQTSEDSIDIDNKSKCYIALGNSLIKSKPSKDIRLPILNEVWKNVTKMENPSTYLQISFVFIQYILQNFSFRELNIILTDLLKHIKKDFRDLQKEIFNIVEKILLDKSMQTDIEGLLLLDNFMSIVDLLEKKYKVDACKLILSCFSNYDKVLNDTMLIHILFDVSKHLHDNVDFLCPSDELRQISNLISNFIRKIDYGKDFEQQLNIYMECRHIFSSLDTITYDLIQHVLSLSVKLSALLHGRKSKKTVIFNKACLSYCFITICSLSNLFHQFQLYLSVGSVCLFQNLIVLGESCFKAAISLIPQLPPAASNTNNENSDIPTSEYLCSYLSYFASILLVFPGHPQHGPFYLVHGLLNAVETAPHWKNAPFYKGKIYLDMLRLFCAYFQTKYIYHIQGVDSNDTLFGSETNEFRKQVCDFISRIADEILNQLSLIGNTGLISKGKQSTLALDFVNVLISNLTINEATSKLLIKLFELIIIKDELKIDDAYLLNTIVHLKTKLGSEDNKFFGDIMLKIKTLLKVE